MADLVLPCPLHTTLRAGGFGAEVPSLIVAAGKARQHNDAGCVASCRSYKDPCLDQRRRVGADRKEVLQP